MDENARTRGRASTAIAIAITAVLAGALLLLLDSLLVHAVGYVVGCLVPFTAVALARREDVRLRGEEGLIAPAWRRGAYPVILVTGFVVAGAHSWAIAWDIARRVQL